MSEDLQAILDECKEGNLAIIGGEIIEPSPDEVPLVLMLDKGMYNQLMSMSMNDGYDISEFVLHHISNVIMNNTFMLEDDVEKVAGEYVGSVSDASESEDLEDSDDPPDTDDETSSDAGFIGWGYGSLSEEKNPSVLNQEKYSAFSGTRVFEKFKQVIANIHGKREGDIDINLSFNNPGEIKLKLEYPEDGYRFECHESGGLDTAMTGIAQRLAKWCKVAFSPKLTPDTPVLANVTAKVVGFDKSAGQYMIEFGDGVVALISPEDLNTK